MRGYVVLDLFLYNTLNSYVRKFKFIGIYYRNIWVDHFSLLEDNLGRFFPDNQWTQAFSFVDNPKTTDVKRILNILLQPWNMYRMV